jgi:hypothetical protein
MDSYAICKCESCGMSFVQARYGKHLPTEARMCNCCKDKQYFNPKIQTPALLGHFKKRRITPTK